VRRRSLHPEPLGLLQTRPHGAVPGRESFRYLRGIGAFFVRRCVPGFLLVLFKLILGVPAALPYRAGRLGGRRCRAATECGLISLFRSVTIGPWRKRCCSFIHERIVARSRRPAKGYLF
jgi:hypothetical protein